MNKMSSFQIVLLSVFAAMALAGVLIFAFFVSTGSSKSVGPVSIWGTFSETAIQQVLATMGTTYPDLQNVHYVQKDTTTYMSDLTDALASGQAPDLFFLTEDQAYSQAARISSISSSALSASQFDNSFIAGAAPFSGTTGTLALPLLSDPLVLFWNKDLLQANGYSQPPQYWDELYDFAQKVTRKTEDGAVRTSAIAFGAYSNVDHAKEILSMLIMQAGGKITTRDSVDRLTSAILSDSAGGSDGLSASPTALRFFTEFADASKPDYSWNRSLPHSRAAFTAGMLALYIGYASEKNELAAANPNLNFGIARVPQIRNAKVAVDAGRVWGAAVAKGAKNPNGAYTIAALMASADISSALSSAVGILPARRDLLAKLAARANGNLAPSEDNLTAADAIVMRTWTDPNPTKTDAIFQAMIDNTTSGAVLLNEAISRADQQMNNLIGI